MTRAGNLYGRGIGFPPRIGANGRFQWSEGTDNIREAIRIILLTDTGERLMLSEFGAGLKRFLYEPNTIETRRLIEERITLALEQWEPRIQLKGVRVEQDAGDAQQAIATIQYKLIATQQSESVSVQLKLGG
jgi:uncharacterized protein